MIQIDIGDDSDDPSRSWKPLEGQAGNTNFNNSSLRTNSCVRSCTRSSSGAGAGSSSSTIGAGPIASVPWTRTLRSSGFLSVFFVYCHANGQGTNPLDTPRTIQQPDFRAIHSPHCPRCRSRRRRWRGGIVGAEKHTHGGCSLQRHLILIIYLSFHCTLLVFICFSCWCLLIYLPSRIVAYLSLSLNARSRWE